MEQKIEIKAKDENNHLIGRFIITSEIYDSYLNKLENKLESTTIDNCKLSNIPIVDNLEDDDLVFSPIIYSSDSSEFSNILLSEEVRYKIHFKRNSNYDIKDYTVYSSFLEESNTLNPIDLINDNEGYLNFRSYVGKTFLDISHNNELLFSIPIEIRSKKMDYHNQYKTMIGDLSNYSSTLIFYSNSPVYQYFDLDIQLEKNYYEYFMFFEYLFREENLPSTFEYLSHNLYTQLKEEIETVPSSVASNITPDSILDMMANPDNLDEVNDDSYLSKQLNGYVPKELNEITYYDDVDTPENRFYKNFLETIDNIIEDLLESSESGYIMDQLLSYREKLSYFLSQRYFKEIGRMDFPPLNSQVLQKKEGYRDILQYFLMLEFTFRMSWDDLSDKFIGYEKKLSELYELWCYFQLLEVLQELTDKEIFFEDIFENNDWYLSLNKGKAVKGSKIINDNLINIELRYNKTFSNNDEYFKSYSLNLKPDYTFVISIADERYFIHFDAKYRVYLESENFKEGDIYKMHTYKDAILGSVGAFVLYPGEKKELYEDIHDYKYGVGAFPLNPGDDGDNKEKLVDFIEKLIISLLH